MRDNQERLRHGRVTHDASVRKQKARPYRLDIGASSFDAGAHSFQIHVSPTSSSRRHKSYNVTLDAPISPTCCFRF